MTKREELDLFLERGEDFVNSKYILADVKLASFLKAIALSDTLLALFKNCLTDFDYANAQKKYLVKTPSISHDKGEFILPPNSRELLAFIFSVLVDIDAKRLDLNGFLTKYFFVDGSSSSAYGAFINAMIKPFISAVKVLMESVLEGSLQDPIEALVEEEKRKEKEKQERELSIEKEKAMLAKVYGASLKGIKDLLLKDKQKIKDSKLSKEDKEDYTLIVDMLANVIESEDVDAIYYAYLAYKFLAKSKKFFFRGRVKKISKLLKDVLNGIQGKDGK